MYDIIYIGGGLGYAGAVVAAKEGLKVALIEKKLNQLGGVCLHKGCIPSKMFLHYAETLRRSREDFFKGSITVDLKKIQAKKEKLLKTATEAVTRECAKIDLIEANAKITVSGEVHIDKQTLYAKHIIIGTGSSAFIPNGIIYDGKDIITSDEVFTMKTLPKNIAIYGDGAIGLEMSSFFASCGVLVTLISREKKLLRQAHPLLQNAMEKQLQKLGITYLKDHPISKAKSTSKGVQVHFEDGSFKYFQKLLVATGRHPNIDVVAIDDITVSKGIDTDKHFETTLLNHYAIGDCNAKLQLAHAARAQVLYVTQKIMGKKPRVLNLDNVVKFIHTLPMGYATVGQNKAMLTRDNISFKESVVPLSNFVFSAFHDAHEGAIIIYSDDKGFILGAEILAPEAEELIAPVSMALAGEMDASMAQKTIMAHPTFSEAIQRGYFRL